MFPLNINKQWVPKPKNRKIHRLKSRQTEGVTRGQKKKVAADHTKSVGEIFVNVDDRHPKVVPPYTWGNHISILIAAELKIKPSAVLSGMFLIG